MASVELAATPFFAQTQYQCGPAALATVLAASGVDASPDGLVDEVYLPARQGSVVPEMAAATRAHGRVPYLLPEQPQALFAELTAGRPVLVLQKLGAGPWPGWHYAVVVGFDRDSQDVILRSGTDRRLTMSLSRFAVTWDRAGRLAMVALVPGQMPEGAELDRYMGAVAGMEAVGRLDEAQVAYRAAAQRWPDAALPQLGLANIAAARGDLAAAEHGYREALRRDPRNVPARNNLAEVLLQRGCPQAASGEIEIARQSAGAGPLSVAVEATASQIARQVGPDHAGCPSR